MPVPAGSATMVTGASRARVSQAASRRVLGGVGGAFDGHGRDGRGVHLVQDGRQLDPPVGQAGPGEVGVAGLVGARGCCSSAALRVAFVG